MDPRTSKRIFELAREQQEELGSDEEDEDEDEAFTTARSTRTFGDEEEEDDDDEEGIGKYGDEDVEVEELVSPLSPLSASHHRLRTITNDLAGGRRG